MSLEFVDVRNNERFSPLRCISAYPTSPRYLDARGLSLKCVQYKLFAVIQIKSRPIYFIECIIQKRGCVGEICRYIRHVGYKRFEIFAKPIIVGQMLLFHFHRSSLTAKSTVSHVGTYSLRRI